MEAETAKLVEHLKRAEQANEHDRLFAEVLHKAADTIERLQEVADERGESFARSIEDFNNMRDQRDAALAERDVALIGSTVANEQAESDRSAVRPILDKLRKIADEHDAALAEVERLRSELEIEARRPINLMGNQG